jgi:TRAP-type transport system small permease protein
LPDWKVRTMENVVNRMSAALAVIATMSTVVLMFAITADVIVRNVTSASIPGVLELSETALVFAIFFGLAYTGATGGHIAVNLLTSRLPEKTARAMQAISWLLVCILLMWLIYATGTRAIDSFSISETRMGLVNWPVWPSRWVIVTGFCAMLLVSAVNTVRVVTGKDIMGESELDSAIGTSRQKISE